MPRNEIYLNGSLLRVEDDRTLADAIAERKQVWGEACTAAIRTKVSETDERNAANGVYDSSKQAEIVGWIQTCRAEYLRCKAEALSATTNDEVDAVLYNTPA